MNERDIFDAALAISDSQQRATFLEQACGENQSQRREIEEMLDAQERLGSFLQGPPAGLEATIDSLIVEKPGTQIGPYKLLQRIGEGGFGVVYMAEQHKPVRRKVALKIIKPGMDTREVIARFEAERQALALMDHPNIAKVFDAGETDTGRPYFVMELVKGVPLIDFCDENHLANEQRLELFMKVCRAIQHAHQKGIIHRDLKPSNVMVTIHDNRPVPKVIDFGVSKAISQQLTEKTLFTAYGQMVGTPTYMSPEQAQMTGLDVDTRSDIYSLGVMLFELLTGSTPLDAERLRKSGYEEMQRLIREEEAPRPSQRVSTQTGEALAKIARCRGAEAGHLEKQLRGELDWIVIKALEKDRNRRYETANDFAADIERHLNHEAVKACPPSASYQIARFVRRHKGPAIAVAVVFLALLLGIAGTTAGLVVANAARGRAEEEARRKGIAEAEATKSKYEALEVAQKNIILRNEAQDAQQESERVSAELSVTLTKVSEESARNVWQRAHSLVVQHRPQEALLLFNRALESLPAKGTALEREIRTAMGAVAEKLPQPLFVMAPERGQVFSKSEVSRDGKKILLLVETDPPAEPRAIEVRVIDTSDGIELSRIPVDPKTYWAGFSGDGETVLTADSSQLRRYSAESGSLQGPAYDLATPLEEYTFTRQIPPEILDRVDDSRRESIVKIMKKREQYPAKIVAIDPAGKSALFESRTVAATPGGYRTRLGLLDLESGRTEFFPDTMGMDSAGRATFAPDGRRLFAVDLGLSPHQMRAWDLAPGELQEAWQQELPFMLSQWSPGGHRALLQTSEALSDRITLKIFDLEGGKLLPAELEVASSIIDAALSPSGRKAVALTSPDPQSTEITIWDIAENRSRSIPLSTSAGSQDGQDGHVAFGATENTVVTWDHDLLVGWQLAPEPRKLADLGGAAILGLQPLAAGKELISFTRGGPATVPQGPWHVPTPIEIHRYNTERRQPTGKALPIMADCAVVSPDEKTLVTALGRGIQRWDMATMSKIGEGLVAPRDRRAFTGLGFVGGGRILVTYRTRNVSSPLSNEARRVTYFVVGVEMSEKVERGVLVNSVLSNTPADAAGLQAGDEILRIGDEPVDSMAEFREVVDLQSANGIEVTFLRDGKELTRRVEPEPRTKEDIASLASAYGEVRLWDLESGQEVSELPIPLEGEAAPRFADVSPDGRWVVTVGKFGQRAELRKFDAFSGRPVAPSVKYLRPIRGILYGPRGRVLATVDTRSEVQLWNARDLTRAGSRIRPSGTITRMLFNQDGSILLVTTDTDDGPRLCLWDTSTGNRLTPPMELPDGVRKLTCSPDGRKVTIAGQSGGLWEYRLPPIWEKDATESIERVEALAGCALTEQGDVEPLEASQWAARIAGVEFARSTYEPEGGRDLWTVWRESEAYSILTDETKTDEEELAALDLLIEGEPDFWPARMGRIILRLRQGRLDEAREDAEAAGENRVEIVNVLRRTLEPHAERLLDPFPGLLGVAENNLARDRCLSWCDLILAIEPEDATALFLRTPALAQAERYDEAEEAIQTVVKAGPEDLVVENLWATVQGTRAFSYGPNSPIRSGIEVKRSQWLLDRLLEMRPDDWRFLVKRAEYALGDERVDDALADIDRAAELGPAKKVAEQLTFMRSGIPPQERTLEWLREETRLHKKILELDPDHEAARKLLGDLYGRLGQWEEAADELTRMTESDADAYQSQIHLAAALLKLKRTDRYSELCREMHEERGGPSNALLWQADVIDDYGPAIESWRASLDNPNLTDRGRTVCEYYLGLAYFRAGDYPQAIQWAEKCIESEYCGQINQIRARSVLAMAYHESGDQAKASEMLAQAVELYSQDAPEQGVDDLGSSWPSWLICELLLEEAKEKVAGHGEQDGVAPEQEESPSDVP